MCSWFEIANLFISFYHQISKEVIILKLIFTGQSEPFLPLLKLISTEKGNLRNCFCKTYSKEFSISFSLMNSGWLDLLPKLTFILTYFQHGLPIKSRPIDLTFARWELELSRSVISSFTMLQKLSRWEVMAWLCWNLIILPPVQLYVKSIFGEFRRSKNVIFGIFRD